MLKNESSQAANNMSAGHDSPVPYQAGDSPWSARRRTCQALHVEQEGGCGLSLDRIRVSRRPCPHLGSHLPFFLFFCVIIIFFLPLLSSFVLTGGETFDLRHTGLRTT